LKEKLSMKKQAGFTLIELIAVIVILAILAVVAVPQYVDLRSDAATAAGAGIGGAISSGTALNYAKGAARGASANATVVNACTSTQLAPLAGLTVTGGNIVSGGITYTISGTGPATSGATASCTITPSIGSATSFNIIGCANTSCS
jgi:MSHA pilin protein MshA